jgi:glutathione synthase
MRSERLRVGFLMDPLEEILVHHDSTFALMLECGRRGHEVLSFQQEQLYALDGRVRSAMRSVALRREQGRHFDELSTFDAGLDELDILFLRKDPPVDVEFWHATQLVELAGERPFCINSPAGLRDANEKLFALRFPELTPRTLVSADTGQLRSFIGELGRVILKPVDGFAGRGVVTTHPEDPNLSSLLELLTGRGTQAIVAQAFLPESSQGDKRIILLDGEPLGAILRVAAQGELRCNMAAGGRAEKTSLTPRDREICRQLGPELSKRGLYLVGIDVIGEYLTEVNVTSPTGIAEIDSLDGSAIERAVIDFAEERCHRTGGDPNKNGRGIASPRP